MTLNLLINAYTCCPGMGSEQGMGWHWITGLARYCNLYIISEGEYRPQIEAWMTDLQHRELANNMHFYWNPVSDKVRKRCWRQGNWLFYFSYKRWQQKTEQIAYQIVEKEHIDILHQLNMTGFREPGYLWRISQKTEIPFVWGPIGGMMQYPWRYIWGAGLKRELFLSVKYVLNHIQRQFHPRVSKALEQASLLISATPDSQYVLSKMHGKNSVLIQETGCFVPFEQSAVSNKNNMSGQKLLKVMWVGKFTFRKRLDIAIEAIAKTRHKDILLSVYGYGNESQNKKYSSIVAKHNITDRVSFIGHVANDQILSEMRKADILLFTSVCEETSTVVVEAISNQLPVICFNACGMATIVDKSIGRKIRFTNPRQSIFDFAHALDYFYEHRDELQKCSDNCIERAKQFSWDNKIEQMYHLYENILKGKKQKI